MVSARSLLPTIRRGKILPNLSGNVFVITEASSRTGIAAARSAAELGGEVVLLDTNSNFTAAGGTLEKLKYSVPHGSFVCIDCDFRHFHSVKRAINIIKARYANIYCLLSGAGTVPADQENTRRTDEGEEQAQIHLSHILLVAEMIPLLEAHAGEAGDARILNHSGVGCLRGAKHFQENDGDLSGADGTKIMQGRDGFHRYLKPKVSRSARRARTAFKNSAGTGRPGTPLLALARFVRIKAAKSSTATTKTAPAGKSVPLLFIPGSTEEDI
eukprot:CAMPEP_0113590570 /NCGR_PEP_ID=MMETSP0015_2-20120614/36757_1 /TAXON_ID=2838 /ORGANISM="Odontella" /LENGTH=270 /DNA_ID=CAMNT_0000496795 /DNA_START=198 /DNA_END=1011 /DNA_ORIENTATION=- /assembly_acc=CAM_ASM_000160